MRLQVVSLDTAKLLKEKGFDIETRDLYEGKKLDSDNLENWNHSKWNTIACDDGFLISAPTLDLAKMWLREKHNIHISIIIRCGTGMYRARIDYIVSDWWKNNMVGMFNTHDEAQEAAIIEALTLIK